MNIDLLKVHERIIYWEYFDNILNHRFHPCITFWKNATLLDKFLCKFTNRFYDHSSGIILSDISDHLPYFV